MDFALTDDQQAIRDLAEQIFADRGEPEQLKRIDAQARAEGIWIDRDLWAALAEAQLLGLPLPETYGGSGLGLLELCLVFEAWGRSLVPLPLLETLVETALPIATFGTNAQRGSWLAGIASGDTVLSAAFHEIGGSDPARPRVRAVRDGSAWRLDGHKTCVAAATLAERVLVPARTDAEQVGLFLLDPGVAGVRLEPQLTERLEPSYELHLDGARVDADGLLGTPDAGHDLVRWIDERRTLALCAVQVGVCAEALRRTAEYTGQRKQFGRPIGSFQGVALRAADAYIDIEAMRSTLWQAIWRVDAGLAARREVGAARWWACLGGHRVVHATQHLHGGIGSDVDYPIHRYFLWAKHIELALGGATREAARIGASFATEAAASD